MISSTFVPGILKHMKNNLLEQLIKVLKRLVCLNVLPCLLIKVFDGHRSPENIFPISEMIT